MPFWFPDKYPLDLFYSHAVAALVGGTRLPPNPPRRIACVSGWALNIVAAVFLLRGNVNTAQVNGGLLFAFQLVVNTIRFCLASFLIEMGLKVVGKSLPTELVSGDEA